MRNNRSNTELRPVEIIPNYIEIKARDDQGDESVGVKEVTVYNNMGNEITKRIITTLKKNKASVEKTKFLILGFSFKENCNDIRNTKVYDIYKNLKHKGGIIHVFDPLVDTVTVKKEYNINMLKKPKNHYYDVIIIAVSHNYL